MHLYDQFIWVIRYDLNYEPTENRLFEIDRRQLERKRRENKRFYYKRVSIEKADEEFYRLQREEAKRNYDKAIMSKYNVGPDYESNRWFMEQVRPYIY